MSNRQKYQYEPEMIRRWREMALSGQSLSAIAKAATEELGRVVGPRAVVNRLTTNFPDEVATIFAASQSSKSKSDPDAPASHQGVNSHVKEPGHPDTWDVLIADMPSLAHLVGKPYEEVVRAPG